LTVCGVEYRVLSVNVGRAMEVVRGGETYRTAIGKRPVSGPVRLSELGFDGDEQADTENHGGPDKAVCVYSHAHYPYWERELGMTLPFGAFGENVTVADLREEDVRIGDVFRLGSALVQISQPRRPCYKLGDRFGRSDLPLLVERTGYTGFYMRVLEEGIVAPEDMMRLERRGRSGITVAFAGEVLFRRREDADAIRTLLEAEALAESVRRSLEARLWKLVAAGLA